MSGGEALEYRQGTRAAEAGWSAAEDGSPGVLVTGSPASDQSEQASTVMSGGEALEYRQGTQAAEAGWYR